MSMQQNVHHEAEEEVGSCETAGGAEIPLRFVRFARVEIDVGVAAVAAVIFVLADLLHEEEDGPLRRFLVRRTAVVVVGGFLYQGHEARWDAAP
eukprot:scaffold934_cov226-Pinguiococcus_pyrenoidosus.AAC.3